jgi:hypothetical protein
MGPPLLLDKSGIQSLLKKLLPMLSRYYLLVVPPILVLEILGDLLKKRQGGRGWVRILAEKVGTTRPFINVDHRELRVESLLGKPITMDGRPVVASEGFDTTQGKSALITETKEHLQLLRWRFEEPSALEEQSAREWKQAVSSVDLEKAKAQFKSSNPDLPRVKSFTELRSAVDIMLQFGDQMVFLEMCLEDAHLDEDSRNEIRARWAQIKSPALWSFAPYAFFCFRIRMLFHVGLINNLVTTRSSNIADLVYLYYTPFCNVFSSNDRLHEDLAPLVLRPDQYFIRTTSLRSDFEAIDFFREQLSNDQKRMWHDRFGDWPPRNSGSFTYRMWTRKMTLPKGLRRGNALKKMSPEAKKKMDEHVREVMQQFKEIQE